MSRETETTRQGVRNLNNIGPRIKTTTPKPWTCPPCLPADRWEASRDGYDSVLRCRVCHRELNRVSSW